MSASASTRIFICLLLAGLLVGPGCASRQRVLAPAPAPAVTPAAQTPPERTPSPTPAAAEPPPVETPAPPAPLPVPLPQAITLAPQPPPPPPPPPTVVRSVPRFYLEAAPGEASVPARLPLSGTALALRPQPVLGEFDVQRVDLARDDLGLGLLFELRADAARDLARLTARYRGRRLVLTLNEVPIAAQRIEHAWSNGSVLMHLEAAEADLPGVLSHVRVSLAEASRAQKATVGPKP